MRRCRAAGRGSRRFFSGFRLCRRTKGGRGEPRHFPGFRPRRATLIPLRRRRRFSRCPAGKPRRRQCKQPMPRPSGVLLRQSTRNCLSRAKIWLQLASATDPQALPSEFRRMKSNNRELFDGITGYVARVPTGRGWSLARSGARPTRRFSPRISSSVGIDASSWSNSESDKIVPLGTE